MIFTLTPGPPPATSPPPSPSFLCSTPTSINPSRGGRGRGDSRRGRGISLRMPRCPHGCTYTNFQRSRMVSCKMAKQVGCVTGVANGVLAVTLRVPSPMSPESELEKASPHIVAKRSRFNSKVCLLLWYSILFCAGLAVIYLGLHHRYRTLQMSLDVSRREREALKSRCNPF